MFKFLSPAKVNHFLHIHDKREDGYHNLNTLFQYTDWCDEITISILDSNEVKLTVVGEANLNNTSDNLIIKAVSCFHANLTHREQLGFDIRLEKNIPIGAGLGGGSSNAATMLFALNKIYHSPFTLMQLKHMGATLGADVPFFLHGYSAIASGIGEELTSVEIPEEYLLIVNPKVMVSTAKMFSELSLKRKLSKKLTLENAPGRIVNLNAKCADSVDAAYQNQNNFGNDFLSIACESYPSIQNAFTWLSDFAKAKLSGSGACIFACFKSKNEAEYVASLAPQGLAVNIAKGLNNSRLLGHAF